VPDKRKINQGGTEKGYRLANKEYRCFFLPAGEFLRTHTRKDKEELD